MSRFWKRLRGARGGATRVGWSRNSAALRFELLEPRLALTGVVINEFLASNDGGLADVDGDHSDWIELYNSGAETVDLSGWYLTDSPTNLTKWQFPSVSLDAGEYLVVFASSKNRTVAGSELHTNFALSADGEYLGLIESNGTTVASEFFPAFPPQFEDVSYGRTGTLTETLLVGASTPLSVLVPTNGSLGTTWTLPSFSVDGSWQSGTGGVGYADVIEPGPSTTVLQVDFNNRGNTSVTEPGFSSFVIGGTEDQTQFGSITRSYGGIDVTLTDVSGFGYIDRLRATPPNAGDFTESLLLRDMVFSRDNTGTSGMDVVIAGLTLDEVYTLTVWSFDTGSVGTRTSNWTANGVVAAENYSFNGTVHPTSNDTYRFGVVVTTDGLGRITLQGRRDELNGDFAVFLNALRVETGDTLHPPAGIDEMLRVDFNSRSGGESGAANTEPGYQTMDLDESSSVFSGTTVTVSAYGAAELEDGDRMLPAADGAFSLDQVYDDFIYANGPAGSGLEILITGLAPNAVYDVALRSFDASATGSRQATWTEVGSGQILASPYTFDGSVMPTSNDANTLRARLVASANGSLLLRGVQVGSETSVVVNAFELTRATLDELVGTDVEASMRNTNSSAYIRAPFTVADLSAVDELYLDMQFDSGFVAYLNGQEVARRNAPTASGIPPAYNAGATHERTVVEAVAVETIDLSGFTSLLNEGGNNVLAIHGLNSAAGDDDFLIAPTLRAVDVGGLSFGYFLTPTPGGPNGTGFVDFVSAVQTSESHGFYDDPFFLELQTATDGSQIYFTYDGSVPSPDNSSASLYTGAIFVDRTTVLRARAYKSPYVPSPVTTQTYIFLDDVIGQTIDPNNPANNPFGLSYPAFWQQTYSGNYNMNQDVVAAWDDFNPNNMDFGIREALQSIPTMSIVMDHIDLWDPSLGIYPNAINEGSFWRRPGSIEYFDPNTGANFQYNVGVQMHGAASRDNLRLKKHSFRLIFNSEFDGPGRLNFPLFEGSDFADINTIVLKASFTDSFATRTFFGRYSPLDSTYTRDVWMLDSQRAMGSVAPLATYTHLYINGLYWGVHYVTERMDDASLASHLGGEPEDWDVIKDFNELFRGNTVAWNAMFNLARQINAAPNKDAIYFALQGRNPDGTLNPSMPVYLDVENLIDYMVLHLFAGVEDWPSHNWVAGRNRVDPGKGFQFFTWDQEIALDGYFRDRTSVSNSFTPAELYSLLRQSPEFRLHFADRVQKHLFNDGALTLPENQARWMARADQIEAAIIGESARWGDARAGEVVNVPPTTTIPVMTVDHWRNSIDQVMGYFSQSHNLAISRFTTASLFPSLGAPLFGQFGGEVEAGFELALSKPVGSPGAAVIYYTLDGSDPRLVGGGLNTGSAIAYVAGSPIALTESSQVRARILNGSTWSPIVEATFVVAEVESEGLPGDYDGNLVVDIDDYLEWKNAYGSVVPAGTGADGNGDGIVDAADYTIWRNNLGNSLLPPPDFSFDAIDQTYTQNFNGFRGTEATLPPHFTVAVVAGTDIYRGVFDSRTDSAASFTGIMAATSNGEDYSFAWRESTGAAGLGDTRVLFTFTNNTGEAIAGFHVSFEVEAWVNGRRDNQVRFKYDVYPDSDASQAAEGRNAFETDIFATVNPNHTPIPNNGSQFVLDGKASANRVTVSGYVDLSALLVDAGSPELGFFGALLPGETAYFRWQISNALLSDGNRSALGIDNVSITVLAAVPGGGSGGLAGTLESDYEQLAPRLSLRSDVIDLALAEPSLGTSPYRSPFDVLRSRSFASTRAPHASDGLLLLARTQSDRPMRDAGFDAGDIDELSRWETYESVRDRHFAEWGLAVCDWQIDDVGA